MDLQVHTPFSALNNGFGSDFPAYAKQLIERACKDDIAVVGVTDYFTIQGYTELKTLLASETALKALVGEELVERAAGILFLPNIELRLSTIVRNPQGADSRVNFHVFFSDSVSPAHIEEHFLRELKFTADANTGGEDERWALNPQNLTELGKRLKAQHANFQGQTDIFVGMMNAMVDHSEVSKILESKPSVFKDRYLLGLPCDEDLSKCSWDGQGIWRASYCFKRRTCSFRPMTGLVHSRLERGTLHWKSSKRNSRRSNRAFIVRTPTRSIKCFAQIKPTFRALSQTITEITSADFLEVPIIRLRTSTIYHTALCRL